MYIGNLYIKNTPPSPNPPTLEGEKTITNDITPSFQFISNGGSYYMSDGNGLRDGEFCLFTLQISDNSLFL